MPGKEPQNKSKTLIIFALIAILSFAAMATLASSRPVAKPQNLPFSVFLDKIDEGEVSIARVQPSTMTVTGQLEDKTPYRTTYPPDYELTSKLDMEGITFTIDASKGGGAQWLLAAGLIGFIVVLILLGRSRNSAAKATSGAPGRMVEAGEVSVTFKDVAGCDEVVAELSEIKQFLSDPKRFSDLGASIPKGVLLFGPPGTGKTLLARAVAGEAGVPFFSISGSDFVEMYVGVGASRVRKLFEEAKKQAPCVIFIDEIDAVGRRRSGSSQGGQEERENTLNQLLVEIDGFAPTDNVIVMAASNRADILDPALTRPGRFDRQVIVDSPDRAGRFEILKVHSKGKPFAEGVELESIASQTAGFCGADLANLVNEAALLAAREGRTEIISEDVEEATMRVLAGPQKNRIISDHEKRTIAIHEMGHAIVAHVLPDAEPVHKVTVVGRGRALGLMVSLQEEDKLLRTRSELMAQMAVSLGGRVAEEIIFTEITTGAANDLEKVNELAQAMVLKLGMSDEFALRSYVMDEQLMVHSADLRNRIDDAIDAIVGEAKLRAQSILLEHKSKLEDMASMLIDRETIDRKHFDRLFNGEAFEEVFAAELAAEAQIMPAPTVAREPGVLVQLPAHAVRSDEDPAIDSVDGDPHEPERQTRGGVRHLRVVGLPASEASGSSEEAPATDVPDSDAA